MTTSPRGARYQFDASPWARGVLLEDAERATRLGIRARELHANVVIGGKTAGGPWTVRIMGRGRTLQFRGRALHGLIEFGLDRWEAGADDRGIRWTAGPDGLAHGHAAGAPWTQCGAQAIAERFAHPETRRCAECWRTLDRKAVAA